jgi:predicted phage terminase large subunit-like protein
MTQPPSALRIDPTTIDLSQFTSQERLVVEEYLRRQALQAKGDTLLDFIQTIAPWFTIEEVHIAIAERLEKIVTGEVDRLMLFIAPRTGKSQMASVFFPAYYIGKHPYQHIMQVGHSATMSEGFGREARNLLMTPEYREIYPGTELSKDSRSVSAWATTKNGKYATAGVDTGIAGKGFALGILDDLLNEKTAISKTAKEGVWNWYGPGFYSRKMPRDPRTGRGSAIINIQTRWAVDDLAGRLLAQQHINPEADKWDVLSIPAVLDEPSAAILTRISHDPKYAKYLPDCNRTFFAGDSFAPRRFPLEDLMRTKHGSSMSPRAWSALYMQNPVAEEGGLLRSEWWKPYDVDNNGLPVVDYVFQSYDVAAETAEHNDLTARTTWGVFKRKSDGKMCFLLLEALEDRLDFPDLLKNALDSFKEYRPDRILVEKASSGIPLYQEMRRRGIPVSPIKPTGSKYSRADAATIPLSQGVVYYPKGKRWAQRVIDNCAAFPAGEHDDVVDSFSMAMNYGRRMFLLETPDDEEDEDDDDLDKPAKRSYATRRSRLPAAA